MSDYQSVLTAASDLPVEDKLRLIDALASSVPDDQPPSLSDEWIAEINRRSDQIDRGEVSTVPWEDVRQDLQRRLELDGSR